MGGGEIDLGWAARARRELADGRLAMVVGDALQIGWGAWEAGGESGGERPRLVAGNLPYNVATPIVERLLTGAPEGAVVRAGFLVQREVAERMAAGPGDPAYGYLSVLVSAHAAVRRLGRVRPGSFRPPPKVESAFVGLEPHPPPLPRAEMPGLLRTVGLAFGQRRKTLRNALATGWGKWEAGRALARAGVPAGARAEELGLEAFVALHRARRELAPAPAVHRA